MWGLQEFSVVLGWGLAFRVCWRLAVWCGGEV